MKLSRKIVSISAITILLTTLSLTGCKAPKEELVEYQGLNISEDAFLNNVDCDRAMKHINNLSDKIGVRLAGSDNEKDGAAYIEDELKKMGYTVSLKEFEYESFSSNSKVEKNKSINIEAVRKPSRGDSNDSGEIVYVTAHYDSVQKSPGANDNASGVAAMLEIADVLKDLDIDKEIRFVAFGAEELGLIGSMNYVEKLSLAEKKKIIGCFNLDMVATAYDPVSELGVYTADGRENLVTEAVKKSGKQLESLSTDKVSYDGEFDNQFGSSDHEAFSMYKIPAALFINVNPKEKFNVREAFEPYYHTPDDSMKNVSKDRLERTIKLVGRAVYDVIDIEN